MFDVLNVTDLVYCDQVLSRKDAEVCSDRTIHAFEFWFIDNVEQALLSVNERRKLKLFLLWMMLGSDGVFPDNGERPRDTLVDVVEF